MADAMGNQIKAADWVYTVSEEPNAPEKRFTGIVTRAAKNGVWADVKWSYKTPRGGEISWSKRLQQKYLVVTATLYNMPGGMTVTDMGREQELTGGQR